MAKPAEDPDHPKPKEPWEPPDVTGWLIYALLGAFVFYNVVYAFDGIMKNLVG